MKKYTTKLNPHTGQLQLVYTDEYITFLAEASGITIEEIKADPDIADALSKKHDIQIAETVPTDETGISVQDALNTLENDKVDKISGSSLVADTEIAKIHSLGSDNQTADTLFTNESGISVQDHIDDIDNPHEVTAEQVDAYTKEEVDDFGFLTDISGQDHSSLANINWSNAGHIFDIDLDISPYSLIVGGDDNSTGILKSVNDGSVTRLGQDFGGGTKYTFAYYSDLFDPSQSFAPYYVPFSDHPTNSAISLYSINANYFYGDGNGLTNLTIYKGSWEYWTDYYSGQTVEYNGSYYMAIAFSGAYWWIYPDQYIGSYWIQIKGNPFDQSLNTIDIPSFNGLILGRADDYSTVPLSLLGNYWYSKNLQEWKDYSGNILSSISPYGVFTGDGSGLTNIPTNFGYQGSWDYSQEYQIGRIVEYNGKYYLAIAYSGAYWWIYPDANPSYWKVIAGEDISQFNNDIGYITLSDIPTLNVTKTTIYYYDWYWNQQSMDVVTDVSYN